MGVADGNTPEAFWSPSALRERVSQLLLSTSVVPDFVNGFFDQLLRLISYSPRAEVSGIKRDNHDLLKEFDIGKERESLI